MKADGSLRSLLQGVSQQPAETRLPGQCTAQDNMTSNPVSGLSRRAPLEFIKKLYSTASAVRFYELDYGAGHEYILAASAGLLRVFDLSGNEHTITDTVSAGAYSYLSAAPLSMTTVNQNSTYIADTTKTLAMNAAAKPMINYNSFILLLGGAYSRQYSVTVTWNQGSPAGPIVAASAAFTTPNGTSSAHTAIIATTNIATELTTALNATTTNGFNTEFTAIQFNDHIYLVWSGARTDRFRVTVSDGDSNVNIVAVNNSVSDISKLPVWAPQGYWVRVIGDPSSGADDFYLEFQCDPDSSGAVPAMGAGFGLTGRWSETVKDAIPYSFNLTTMPHVLTYNPALMTFSWGYGPWANRGVGDDTTNPLPSFVGKSIEDLSYFQGRLVLLSGQNVLMSRTNKPANFWVKTATAKTDSDPIDISSTVKGVRKMLRAIPHNRDLIIFSDAGQFIVFGRNALTPSNSSLVLTTTFEAELSNARPVSAGRNVFFSINYGKFTGIREFYAEAAQDSNDSRPITQQVLEYIPGMATELASTSNFNLLLVRASGAPNHLSAYEYIWEGDQKVQSSWSRWIFPNPIVMTFFKESTVYIVQKIGTEYSLTKMGLDLEVDPGLTYNVRLDNKASKNSVTTTISALYPTYPDFDSLVFVQGAGCPNPGLKAEVLSYDAGTGTVTFKRDMEGGTIIYGQRYKSSYTPTIPQPRDQEGIKIDEAVLTINNFEVRVKNTGTFYSRKFSPYRDDVIVQHSSYFIGDPLVVVGEPAINTNKIHIVPFKDKIQNAELELYTDSHEPLTILTMGWKGQYNKRGKRIQTGG